MSPSHTTMPARLDLAFGVPYGTVEPAPPLPVPGRSVRWVLEDSVLRRLERPPCGVMFSGGVDSTLVLAIAVHLARRHGLEPPIPITYRFPKAPGSEEDDHQEAVVEALGVEDWCRITLEEFDCIGPWARRAIELVGHRLPFNLFFALPALDRLGGSGSLLTGAGGDEFLSAGTHRRAAEIASRRQLPSRADLRPIVKAFAPGALRVAWARHWAPTPPWLTDTGRGAFRAAVGRAERRSPWRYDDEMRRGTWPSRSIQCLRESFSALGAATGTELVATFTEPAVVATIAAHGGTVGPVSRGAMVESIAGDLLPPRLFHRRDKPHFDNAFWGAEAREFAAGATADQLPVEHDLVDPVLLVDQWRKPHPEARSFLLAQWCAIPHRAVPEATAQDI